MATKKSTDRPGVIQNGNISGIVEVQISVVPRGRSTANLTLMTTDGKLHTFSLNLSSEQQEAVKGVVGEWLRFHEASF